LLALLLALLLPAVHTPAQAQENACSGVYRHVSLPLTELGAATYTRMDGQETSYTGGLYPDGSNTRPPEHEAAGLEAAAQIVPLDVEGNPDPENGRIVLISIGMSNTMMEFEEFISRTHNDSRLNPRLVLVNGALGNQTAERWDDPQAPAWGFTGDALARRNVTHQQVQVAWVKLTLTRGGDFPAKTLELQAHLENIARNLKQHFPNIRIAYFSSRTRSYTYERGLSPEPLAFEGGFAVKWMIEKQINGDPELNFDPQAGQVKAPYLAWGPYLWIDGEKPREDGRVWLQADLTGDCTHPSASGREKVAEMLFEFFSTDSTAVNWFLAGRPDPSQADPTTAPETAPVPSEPSPTQVETEVETGGTIEAVEATLTSPTVEGADLQEATGVPGPETAASALPEGREGGRVSFTVLGLAILLSLIAGFLAGWGLRGRR